ncbi:hypothetical protein GI482_09215 [Bacillus sp. N3536]|nr:hypothetical protein GI482_09215 [Bacillus sp. N3536]
MDRTEELLNKLLDEHSLEVILGALEEMSRMNREELIINRAGSTEPEKAKNHKKTRF